MAKGVGCSQSVVSKIWCKYKRKRLVKKGKYTDRSQKTSECQDRKFKAICLENKIKNVQQNKMKTNGAKQEPMFVTIL